MLYNFVIVEYNLDYLGEWTITISLICSELLCSDRIRDFFLFGLGNSAFQGWPMAFSQRWKMVSLLTLVMYFCTKISQSFLLLLAWSFLGLNDTTTILQSVSSCFPESERKKRVPIGEIKMSKQFSLALAVSTVGPCLIIIQISRPPKHRKSPSTITWSWPSQIFLFIFLYLQIYYKKLRCKKKIVNTTLKYKCIRSNLRVMFRFEQGCSTLNAECTLGKKRNRK